MPSLFIRADDMAVGDTLLLPFNRTATITAIKPFTDRTVYIRYRTEYGWTRLERTEYVNVQTRVGDANE
jgi:hypothetical protein